MVKRAAVLCEAEGKTRYGGVVLMKSRCGECWRTRDVEKFVGLNKEGASRI